ncbi:hypothetical protein [Paraburkholderia antibiotica]|uniref:Uncharacterized protein n=1 Tax=Paraburkholderia antibiotica TaxID=2728839 RepID=A0A7X9X153_9BURK|nr:hypothetical protein [Paraburkholderia antibiotica]NML29448.1 hypothetical protein [Paraburkholderia antibiotica]
MTDNLEAVGKILGEPVAPEMSDDALKVKRNLLIASFVSIASVLGDLHVNPQSTILGLQFTGLTSTLINKGLLIVTTYLLVHFAWYFFDAFIEWRIRLTGTKVAFQTGSTLGSQHADYPADPRQSTLYNWWKSQASSGYRVSTSLQEMTNRIAGWESSVREAMKDAQELNKRAAIESLVHIRNDMTKLKSAMESIEQTVTSARIPVSLGRFDAWFKFFLKSQNLRWLFIDAGLPLALGSTAVAMLLREVLQR